MRDIRGRPKSNQWHPLALAFSTLLFLTVVFVLVLDYNYRMVKAIGLINVIGRAGKSFGPRPDCDIAFLGITTGWHHSITVE